MPPCYVATPALLCVGLLSGRCVYMLTIMPGGGGKPKNLFSLSCACGCYSTYTTSKQAARRGV